MYQTNNGYLQQSVNKTNDSIIFPDKINDSFNINTNIKSADILQI